MAFKVVDDPTINTTSRTGKLVMGILALIAEFENDIRRERQMDGIAKARERGVRFGRKRDLTPEKVAEIRELREVATVPEIIKRTGLSKASVYRGGQGRALAAVKILMPPLTLNYLNANVSCTAHPDCPSGSAAEINRATLHERTAIIDPDDHRLAITRVRHPDLSPEAKGPMRGCHGTWIEPFSRCRPSPREGLAIVRCDFRLGCTL